MSRSPHVLVEHTRRTGADAAAEIRAFAKCRNERARLPAFLSHYRALGVNRFFVIDNDSDDGSSDYLAEQPDVHLFCCADSFREAHGGVDWLNALLAQFGPGSWCLTVDIDELFIYPGSETTPLSRFTAYLDDNRYQAVASMMLDMYPDRPAPEREYLTTGDLIAASPYFDSGPYERIPTEFCPGVVIRGGMRERVFFPEFRARRRLHSLYEAARGRLARRFPPLHDVEWLRPRRSSLLLTKVPLVRWDATCRYVGAHWISERVVAPESGVLLHFKFLGDFQARTKSEVARAQYYDEAFVYKRYAEKLEADAWRSFMAPESTVFEDSDQLVRIGLMRDSAQWREARRHTGP